MKKAFLLAATIFTVGAAQVGVAQEDQHSQQGSMRNKMMMDANGDGMLSKEEFMQAHENMFNRMNGENGMIAMDDMPKKCMGMMGQGGMMGQDHQMPGGMQKEAK